MGKKIIRNFGNTAMPVTIVGANVNGKPNFMTVGFYSWLEYKPKSIFSVSIDFLAASSTCIDLSPSSAVTGGEDCSPFKNERSCLIRMKKVFSKGKAAFKDCIFKRLYMWPFHLTKGIEKSSKKDR